MDNKNGETLSDETLARWRDCFGHPCAYAHVIIPLLDEVAALRAENQELKNQITSLTP